ncbi:MAG: translocation/assembly module TamB domain-containing protein [Zoogloeaceae bacterium]|nr:translocation/assembly module TamB domain-containing protein [Zoogloeaceae bacterium]
MLLGLLRSWRHLLALAVLLFVALSLAAGWLATTTTGLEAGLRLASWASGGRLRAEGVTGRLIGPLSLQRLAWESPGDSGNAFRLTQVEADWSPARLWQGEISIQRLHVGRLAMRLASSRDSQPPARLALPFALALESLEVGEIALSLAPEAPPVAHDLSASLASDGLEHRLSRLSFAAGNLALSATGSLRGEGDLPLAATLRVSGNIPLESTPDAPTIALEARAKGSLLALPVEGEFGGSEEGGFTAMLTPFAAEPFRSLSLSLRNFSPARWLPGAPEASLEVALEARPEGREGRKEQETGGLGGQFRLRNDAPAPLPSHLPLATLEGAFSWRGGRLELSALQAQMPASREKEPPGRYRGHVLWQEGTLEAVGEIEHLDPSRLFAALAKDKKGRGEINGQLRLAYQTAQKDLRASFILAPGRFFGQDLQGQGELHYAPGRLHHLDLSLQSGRNRLLARGALGKAADALTFELDAPRLDLPGISGDLAARGRLSGALFAPALQGEAKSGRLVLAAPFPPLSLRHLALAADLRLDDSGTKSGESGESQPPFSARLTLARLTAGELNLEESELELSGRQAAHRIRADIRFAPNERLPFSSPLLLSVQADGRLAGNPENPASLAWQGRLERLRLTDGEKSDLLALAAPADLAVQAQSFALPDARWQGNFKGAAWQARISRLDLPFAAQAPLAGEVELESGDLSWLGLFVGESHHPGGRLEARISLSGSREHPRLTGRAAGDGLTLQIPDSGLMLADGRLRLQLEPEALILEELSFANPHGRPPEHPEGEAREKLRTLAETPGRFLAHGRLDADRNGQVTFSLERLGVVQKPEQWLTLSGQGEARLQDGALALAADMRVDGGYWTLAGQDRPALSDDVVIIGREAPAAAFPFPLRFTTGVNLGDRFYFSGAGLSGRLAGTLKVDSEGGGKPPHASGSIRTVGGRFDAYGQQLEIEQGILTFNGLIPNPSLNIRAWRRRQAVEAGVSVTGTAQKPVIRLISEPDVPDVEKLSWLVLGEAPDEQDGGQSVLLAAAQALFGSQDSGPGSALFKLQRDLGISIGVGRRYQNGATSQVVGNQRGAFASGEGDERGQVVRIGTQLAKNLTLSYEQSLAGTENLVKLTFALTRHLSLVGQTGSDNAVDLFYNFRFGRPARATKKETREKQETPETPAASSPAPLPE